MAMFITFVLASLIASSMALPQLGFQIPNQNGFPFVNRPLPPFFPPGFFLTEESRPQNPLLESSQIPLTPQGPVDSAVDKKATSPFDAMSHGSDGDKTLFETNPGHFHGMIEVEDHPTTVPPTTTTEVSSTAVTSLFDRLANQVPASLNKTIDIVKNIISLGRFRRQDLEAMGSLVVPVAFMPEDSLVAESGLVLKSGKLLGLGDGPLFMPATFDQPTVREDSETTETTPSTTESATDLTTSSE